MPPETMLIGLRLSLAALASPTQETSVYSYWSGWKAGATVHLKVDGVQGGVKVENRVTTRLVEADVKKFFGSFVLLDDGK